MHIRIWLMTPKIIEPDLADKITAELNQQHKCDGGYTWLYDDGWTKFYSIRSTEITNIQWVELQQLFYKKVGTA